MEFKLVISHGPVVWAIELAGFDLDTGKEIDRFMLNSTADFYAAKQYVETLSKFTGFEIMGK